MSETISNTHLKISAYVYALVIGISVFYFTMLGSSQPSLSILGTWENIDKWFDADIFRVIKVETDAYHKAHYRDNVHPFFSILTFPIVNAFTSIGSISPFTAVRIAHSLWAAILAAVMFFVILREAESLALAFGVTALGCSSAAFIFWTTVPESFVLGALSISLVILLHGVNKPTSFWTWVATNLIAFSVTITNLSASVVSMILRLSINRIIKILAVTLIIAAAISVLQQRIFPQAGLFFLGLQKEAGYVGLTHKTASQLIYILVNRAVTFLMSGFILPGISVSHANSPSELHGLVPQSLLQAKLTATQIIGLASWWTLLGIGIVKTIRNWRNEDVTKLAVLFLAAQFVLHMAYGENTFLYVLHSLPAVLLLIARALRSTKSLVLVSVLLIAFASALASNLGLFFTARLSLLGF